MRVLMISSISAMLTALISQGAWAEVLISIDKAAQRMVVSVNGQERHRWVVSTGAAGYDTPTGSFRPLRMARTHFSREWDDAPMPHSIFFTPDGHAIHGTNHLRQLGRAASHGCVRLAPRNAATLFALVRSEGVGSTKVLVEGQDGPAISQSGSAHGVNPLEALRRSAAARAKWRVEATASSDPGASPSVTPSNRSASRPGASASPGVLPLPHPEGARVPDAATPAGDQDTLLTRLLGEAARAYRPICSGC